MASGVAVTFQVEKQVNKRYALVPHAEGSRPHEVDEGKGGETVPSSCRAGKTDRCTRRLLRHQGAHDMAANRLQRAERRAWASMGLPACMPGSPLLPCCRSCLR